MKNHDYGIVPFVTSLKSQMHLHMKVSCSVYRAFSKKTKEMDGTCRSSVFFKLLGIANRYLIFKYTRNRHMKVLCCFNLFFGKLDKKAEAEWVGFLKFESIWMCNRDKMQTIFLSFKIEKIKHRGIRCRSEGRCCIYLNYVMSFAHWSELTVQT